MLNTATKKIEDIRRVILYSREKEKQRSIVLYCKMKLRQLKEAAIDSDLLNSKRKRADMSDIVSKT